MISIVCERMRRHPSSSLGVTRYRLIADEDVLDVLIALTTRASTSSSTRLPGTGTVAVGGLHPRYPKESGEKYGCQGDSRSS